MAGHIKSQMYGDPVPAEIRGNQKLFRGIHVFVSGGTWDWYRPIYPGDRIFCIQARSPLTSRRASSPDDPSSRYRRDVAVNQRGEVVGVYRILRVLTERKDRS